jgi:hypothetical protein
VSRARRGSGKHRKDRVNVCGAWLPVPLPFLSSRAFAELSLHARAMLFDLFSMLGANARRNGDLSAPPSTMRARGWTSNATRTAALRELEEAQIIVVTRRGNRSRCALYAVTLWPLDCDLEKLEVGPGSYKSSDWELNPQRVAAPTTDAPANWKAIRKNASACPAVGQSDLSKDSPGDKSTQTTVPLEPARGSKAGRSKAKLGPPGDTYLEGHLLREPEGVAALY